jgi:hypothetical protein
MPISRSPKTKGRGVSIQGNTSQLTSQWWLIIKVKKLGFSSFGITMQNNQTIKQLLAILKMVSQFEDNAQNDGKTDMQLAVA